eukprot:scaffold95363_cov29-Phaeocystis_antarctica.AAC.2
MGCPPPQAPCCKPNPTHTPTPTPNPIPDPTPTPNPTAGSVLQAIYSAPAPLQRWLELERDDGARRALP